jgi:hypothetical protein
MYLLLIELILLYMLFFLVENVFNRYYMFLIDFIYLFISYVFLLINFNRVALKYSFSCFLK